MSAFIWNVLQKTTWHHLWQRLWTVMGDCFCILIR